MSTPARKKQAQQQQQQQAATTPKAATAPAPPTPKGPSATPKSEGSPLVTQLEAPQPLEEDETQAAKDGNKAVAATATADKHE